MNSRRVIVYIFLCLATILSGCSVKSPSPPTSSPAVPAPASSTTAPAPAPAWQAYVNKADGYQIEYPGSWNLDCSKASAFTRLEAGDRMAIIDIFVQPLSGITADDYLGYSNRHIINQEHGIVLLGQNRQPFKRIPSYRLMWKRPAIANRPNDLYLYREINLLLPGKVYTFSLKTDPQHFAQYNAVLDHVARSFSARRCEPAARPDPPAVYPMDIDLQGKTLQLHLPGDKMMFGIFNPQLHPFKYTPQSIASFQKYEDSLGYRFDFIMTYIAFWQKFPENLVESTYSSGRMMMLTWHPLMDMAPSTDSVIIPAIVNGDYDSYITDWARHIKNLGEPVFLRFANEMNGDWDPWCTWFYSKDADLYIDAWRHVYNIFKQEGASNAYFVWNPHDRTYPNFKWNSPEVYYPGSEYVDWVGLTCYNNGTSHAADKWRTFNDMYRPIYNDYLVKYPGKPFIITEFSCNEVGGSKSAWIKDCLASLKNYPNIRIAVWYDQDDGKWLYRLDSTPAAKDAFRRGISDSYYTKNALTRGQVKTSSPANLGDLTSLSFTNRFPFYQALIRK